MRSNKLVNKYRYLRIKPWLIWSLGVSFLFLECFTRIAPSVMTHELMISFSLYATGLSLLSACFYFSYAIMQIPAGSLINRFGAHPLLAVMAFLCALGTILFAFTHLAWLAGLSRFVIGFGAAFAFIGTLKLVNVWFEGRWFGFLAGMTQGLGMFGAAAGAVLYSIIARDLGWRIAMAVIAGILSLIGILIVFLVRDTRKNLLSHQVYINPLEIKLLDGLRILFRNPSGWIIFLYSGFIYAPTAIFGELWCVHFLESTHHLSHEIAAMAEGTIFIGLAIGCPLIGWLSDQSGKRKPWLFISSVLCFILITLIVFIHQLPLYLLFLILFFYGVSNGGVSLSYIVAGELNPQPIMSVSIASSNMASILLGGFFLQPVFGYLLDLNWTGKIIDGVRFYSAMDFYHAFRWLPLCFVIAGIMSLLVKETDCCGK